MGKRLYLQISFSASSLQGKSQLTELHEVIWNMRHRPVFVIGREYNIALPKGKQFHLGDSLEKVSPLYALHSTKESIFVIETNTDQEPYFPMWTEICEKFYPEVRVAAVGGSEDNSYCQELYVPKGCQPS